MTGLSIISFAAGLALGLLMIVSEFFTPSGGFFAGLGYVLGLMALGAGNLVSFILNGINWIVGYRPRWLRVSLLVQALPALLAAGWGVNELMNSLEAERSSAQYMAIVEAINRDDVAALKAAQQNCRNSCQTERPSRPSELLLLASRAGAQQAASHLIEQKATIPGTEQGVMRPTTDLRTCEGLYLPLLDALNVAVARNDVDMVRLLLPVSDRYSQSTALRTATTLDRVALVDLLLKAGASPAEPYSDDESRNTLLYAAAEGAALTVARQWFDAPLPPIAQVNIAAAQAALFQFMESTDGLPRARDFALLLSDHGADWNIPFRDEPSFLAEAIRSQRKDIALVLIEAGASLERLPQELRKEFAALEERDVIPLYYEDSGACIKP